MYMEVSHTTLDFRRPIHVHGHEFSEALGAEVVPRLGPKLFPSPRLGQVLGEQTIFTVKAHKVFDTRIVAEVESVQLEKDKVQLGFVHIHALNTDRL
jgi:hypothetical protein